MSYPSRIMGALHLAFLKVLRGIVCPTCGAEKERVKPLCKACYWALQPPLRTLLFTPVQDDTGEFEDYYIKAMADLKRRNLSRPMKDWNVRAQKSIRETGLIDALKAISEQERANHA
jgi:hypothetical protein